MAMLFEMRKRVLCTKSEFWNFRTKPQTMKIAIFKKEIESILLLDILSIFSFTKGFSYSQN
jgi:hypothetical protein